MNKHLYINLIYKYHSMALITAKKIGLNNRFFRSSSKISLSKKGGVSNTCVKYLYI